MAKINKYNASGWDLNTFFLQNTLTRQVCLMYVYQFYRGIHSIYLKLHYFNNDVSDTHF